jgi:ABC-type oligopeptide transport system ATPase subunit
MRSASDEIMRMEEGRLMNEQQQEEAIFEAMVAYMKQQIKIAQKIMEEDLYPCNCNR